MLKKIERSLKSKPFAELNISLSEAIGKDISDVKKYLDNMPDKEFSDRMAKNGSFLERAGFLDTLSGWADEDARDAYLATSRKMQVGIAQAKSKKKSGSKVRESKVVIGKDKTFQPYELLHYLGTSNEYDSLLKLILVSGGMNRKYFRKSKITVRKLGERSPITAAGWQKVEIVFRDDNNLSPPHNPKSNVGPQGRARFLLAKRKDAKSKVSPICVALDIEDIPSGGQYSPLLVPDIRNQDNGVDGAQVHCDNGVDGAQVHCDLPPVKMLKEREK